jgi:hypothetical protein
MRPTNNLLAACAAALAGLLAATSVSAADVPFTCTTDGLGSWTITAFGPTPVTCDDTEDAPCTQMRYVVSENAGRDPEHVALLVGQDSLLTFPFGAEAPCAGDPVTKLGARDCSRKSVALVDGGEGFEDEYRVEAQGDRAVIGSSIALKKGGVTEQCRIASLGSPTLDPNAQLKASEQIVFKGCTVTIPVDPATGEPGTAMISGENCVFVANGNQINSGQLTVNGVNVGTLSYGQGSVASGEASCTTRVINRKLYSWCTCADTDGDDIPNDPIPPCPPSLASF